MLMLPNNAGQFLDSLLKPAPLLLTGTVMGSAIPVNPEAVDFRQSFNYEQSGEPDGKVFVSNELPVNPFPINQPPTQPGSQPKACPFCGIRQGIRREDTECTRCALSSYVNLPIGKQKLAAGAWEHIRAVLALSKKPAKIQPAHSRAALTLLKTFVSEFSIERQKALTEREILEWLAALPTLPPIFAKIVKSKIAVRCADALRTFPEAADLKAAEIGSSPPGSAAPKRRPLTPKQFIEVAVRQGLHCYWCGIRVVREAQIAPSHRAKKNRNTLLYYENGALREAARATIDHLVRVSDGGGNEAANLVISCFDCNLERERVTTNYGHSFDSRSFAQRRTNCRNCGGRFFHPDWGCCSICGTAVVSHFRLFFKITKLKTFFSKVWSKAVLKSLRKVVNSLARLSGK